ncbi:SPFH domain-containing protein [Micromonospora sp. C51]|uniref:SPFH domain-containing protein n=1 Tax=Micromonospora sp. C51 TaxID=2824879 RepID=UPI001B37C6E6|nr:SPFH domain-containing protein [Micromonospora sp. C51]
MAALSGAPTLTGGSYRLDAMPGPDRRHGAAALALASMTALVACSYRTESDEIVLYYNSGAGENTTFRECIEPGTSGPEPVDDQIYTLPTSLRTWNIRPSGGDSDQPIKSSSKAGPNGQAGPEVVVYATAEFYLNTNCDGGENSPVVQFWEKTGRRYGVSNASGEFNDEGWRRMLTNTLVSAEEKVLRELTRMHTADDLDANTNGIWTEIERQLGTRFNEELRARTGGDYFCGPTYDRTRKDCPPVRIAISDINYADPKIAEARAAVVVERQRAEASYIAAQAKVREAQLLAQANKTPGYLELERAKLQLQAAQACAANPNCTLLVGVDGGQVNVAAGK